MFSSTLVIGTIVAYVALLFAVARWGERSAWGKRFAAHPLTFALGLSVYCTTWTFFGSVGRAATGGMSFLPIYIGPTLAMVLGWTVFRRITELKHAHHLTSIADFVSARYGKSQKVAALVTVVLAVGIVPYIALQIKSLSSTFLLLTGGSHAGWFAPALVVMMLAFVIIFGIRHLDPTERHPGMVVAVAVESMVKLVAFLAAGAFVVGVAFSGTADFFAKLDQVGATIPTLGKTSGNDVLTFVTLTVLSAGAFAFLPRQFHQGVIENSNPRHVKTAAWATPLYLLLMNILVVPIAVGGKLIAQPGTSPDVYVLALPLQHGQAALSMAVFIGGVSAALGMVIIETMTMATMVSNHLVLPLATKVKALNRLKPRMLYVRWVAAALLMLAAWQFAVQLGGSQMLVSIGLISFAAAFLIAPVLLGGLYWKAASRAGAMAGLLMGFVVWFYTLLLPTFIKSKWLPDSILSDGPWGVTWLKPEAFLGLDGLPSLAHGVIWSTIFVIVGYVGVSVLWPPSKEEALLTEAFLGDARDQLAHLDGSTATIDLQENKLKAQRVFAEYMPHVEAQRAVDHATQEIVGAGRPKLTVLEYASYLSCLERTLAGVVGSASAHVAMKVVGSIERKDKRELEREFARVLAELKLNPRELKRRVDFEKEKSALLEEQFHELEQKNGELESKVLDRTRELRAILDNVLFGFLVVGPDYRVRDGFTRSCTALLATPEITDRPLGELLGLQGDPQAWFELGIDQLFEDAMPEEVSTSQVQQRFEVAGRVLRAEARAVRDPHGAVTVLLFTLSDVTRLEAAEHENESNRTILNIVRQRPSFEDFIDETRKQLVSAKQAIVAGDTVTVRRMAHTIKGNAACYGISRVVKLVHTVEDQPTIQDHDLEAISEAFRSFLELNAEVLGVSFDVEPCRSCVVSDRDVERLEAVLPQLPADQRQVIADWLATVSQVPFTEILGPMRSHVTNLAAQLNREIDFAEVGLDIRVRRELRCLAQSLIHLLRNTVSHGIEAPHERGQKSPRGKVQLELREEADRYVIRVVDDGKGIDAARVADVAVERGFITKAQAEAMSDDEKVTLIFSGHVSTADEVTDISGRGVGMSAVLAEVQKLGGKIFIETELGNGTSIELVVPRAGLGAGLEAA